jgi:hypothetical protein
MSSELKAIGDKLDMLNGKVDGIKSTMDTHITATEIYRETQSGKLEKLEHTIDGNGHPGLKTKVDRLERSEYIKNWVIGVTFTTTLGVILNYFVHFIK